MKKQSIEVSCLFKQEGADVRQMLIESFRVYLGRGICIWK